MPTLFVKNTKMVGQPRWDVGSRGAHPFRKEHENDGAASVEEITSQQTQKKAIREDRLSQIVVLFREAVRSQPANPWGPWSRRTGPFGPPEGF